MLSSALAPPALAVAMAPSRKRDLAICSLNMWAYLAAYELPHDDPQRLEERVRIDYPLDADRVLGLGVPPTVRLQRGLSTPGRSTGSSGSWSGVTGPGSWSRTAA